MIIRADARMLPLVDGCVQCVVTSPPYFGLRDYGHSQQLGMEETPEEYIASLVAVFTEVRRVLRADGTAWLNLGDSYAAGGKGGGGSFMAERRDAAWQKQSVLNGWRRQPVGCKEKDLLGIPWAVAFALRDDGWYLRSDIIWHKPNPMPESVTDRPTKSHEYMFLLTKSERYNYDADAIKEPASENVVSAARRERADYGAVGSKGLHGQPFGQSGRGMNAASRPYTGQATKDYAAAGAQNPSDSKRRILAAMEAPDYVGRNKRTVWTIPTMPYAGAHFATMPEALVEPCILAGCPMGGLVLDPFCGSGTVLAVAERLGRRSVGTDLSYHDLAKKRTAQRGLRFEMPA